MLCSYRLLRWTRPCVKTDVLLQKRGVLRMSSDPIRSLGAWQELLTWDYC